MPKYRQLHIKIVDSFDFNDMPDDFTRVLWMLLIVVVDSEGRGIDNPAWLRSKMFPMREDVQLKKITEVFDWLTVRGMIVKYQSESNKYFYIPSWKKHQTGTDKEGKSNLPTPDLLQSNSVVTPDLLPVNTIQDNAESIQDKPDENNSSSFCKLYEQEIGNLTSMISQDLIDLSKEYTLDWFTSAVREAVLRQARSLKYIKAILKSWKAKGYKSTGTKANPDGHKPYHDLANEDGTRTRYYDDGKQEVVP